MEYRVLKEYENEYIAYLEDVDLVPLAKKAAECGLLPKVEDGVNVADNLKSLHPEVPRPLMCRYLLYYIYTTVDNAKFFCVGETAARYCKEHIKSLCWRCDKAIQFI